MRHSFWRAALCALALVVISLAAHLSIPGNVAQAEPVAPTAVRHDQVVTLSSAGQIIVTDLFPQTGMVPADWNSGTDTGWEYIAAGKFTTDRYSIVAIQGSRLKVFDPFPQPGQAAVTFERTLSSGYYERIVTGDFDRDGLDEIAVTASAYTPSYVNNLWVYDIGSSTPIYFESFAAPWQGLAAGDFNADGADDLAMVRNPAGSSPWLKVYNGQGWGPIAEDGFRYSWTTLAAGRLSSPNLPDQLALLRPSTDSRFDSLIMLNVLSGGFSDVFPGQYGTGKYWYDPSFTSLALGNLGLDGYDQIFMLRDPVEAGKVGLLMVSPAVTPPRWIEIPLETGAWAWKQVRTGDLNGDGHDDVVILRFDRFRAYPQMWQNESFVEVANSFRVPPTGSDWPVMVLANLDGPGVPAGPSLSVTPGSLNFDLNYGAVSPVQTLSVTNIGTTDSIQWQAQVTQGGDWLQIDQTQGTTPGQIGVSVVTTISPGSYTGNIQINATDPTVKNSPVTITVIYQLTGTGLLVSPKTLDFDVEWGESGPVQEVAITIGGAGQTNWTAEVLGGADWLRIGSTAGTTPSTLYVTVNSMAAGPGAHQGTIKVTATDPQIANSPQYVTVNLNVPDPGFVLYPSQVSLLQQIGAATQMTKEIQVLRPFTPTQWVATALPLAVAASLPEKFASGAARFDAQGLIVDGQMVPPPDWLTFTPDSGTTRSAITVSVAPTASVFGVYHAVIIAVAQDETLADRVKFTTVNAVLANQFYYLPLTMKP